MKNYELMLLVPANEHNESSAKKAISSVKEEIEKEGGKITFEDFWGLRKIAYKIKNNTEGYYCVLNFDFDGAKITNFEKNLNINKDVIRFLVSLTPKDYEVFTFENLKAAEEERYKKNMASKKGIKLTDKRESKKEKKKEKEIEDKIEEIVGN